MVRLMRRKTTKIVLEWIVEPSVGFYIMFVLFCLIFPRGQLEVDVSVDDNRYIRIREGESLGESLLFLRHKDDSGPDVRTGFSRKSALGTHARHTKQEVQHVAHVQWYPMDPLPIPDYSRLPQCQGRRWELTPKTKQLYHVTSYTDAETLGKCPSSVACDLNLGRSPLKLNLTTSSCDVSTCLTVTVKTRFRYRNCIRLINSIHKNYPTLKVIITDEEGREKYVNKSDIQSLEGYLKGKEGLVSYLQLKPGVGLGRKVAAQVAQTKYILVLDDDYVFTELTKLTKLLDVIEQTDASIVGGDTSDIFPYAGAIRASINNTEHAHVNIFPNVYYELVQCFRNCFVSDIVKTFFIADREQILKHGSWDTERKFYEHEDFFLTMRKARLKIVNCKDVKIRHAPINQDLVILRRKHFDIWQEHLFQKWQISDLYICDKTEYNNSICQNQRHFS